MQLQITPVNPQETAHENRLSDLPWSKPRFWRIDSDDTRSGKTMSTAEGVKTIGGIATYGAPS